MKDIRTITENILLEIGANPRHKGFGYIVSAMEVIKEDAKCLNYPTRLYFEVAHRHKTTYTRVERAICYEKKTLGTESINSEFLGTLYVKVNQILREEESHEN